ncbi:glycosyltransferase [Variovorax sp. WS11]|uniref:glycosyltransferase n=1 Tax=Variovorax sp. WS11 TaxID=1105204 RepID=UPI001EF1C8CB|nr:glycosyltransferase [Variovorax sp. WS11]
MQRKLEARSLLPGEDSSALRSALKAATLAAENAQHEWQTVVNSYSWRITAPVRKAGASLPAAWRFQLRRAAKAAWWVVTPWRMPARLRFLKERAAQAMHVVREAETDAYGEWILQHESWTSTQAGEEGGPLVSFLLSASSDRTAALKTLESIRMQTCGRWEAIVAIRDGGRDLAEELAGPSGPDPRVIQVQAAGTTVLDELAACAARASGQFFAIVDAGDILVRPALNEIACALDCAPDIDVLYSDEDRLSRAGARGEPYFKPRWSPELLYSFNYFGRLTLVRRQLFGAVGGLDVQMGAGAEWDLHLRSSQLARKISRLPKVLCHRSHASLKDRPAPDSAASAEHREALRKFWVSLGVAAPLVEAQPDGTFRATWAIDEPPQVSIVIPTKDKVELLRMCIEGLLNRTDYSNKQIVIVDTGSIEEQTQSYYEELRRHPEIRIVHFNRKFNYSAACNYGASFAHGELLLFLNNDIEVIARDWLQEMVRFAMRPGVGVVGTKLTYPSRELQHGGVGIGIHLCGLMYRSAENQGWGLFGSADHPRNWLAIMGACQLVRRDVFRLVGGFDEAYKVAMSDVALCLRAWRAGYRIAYAPHACLVHHEGATRGNTNPSLDVQRIADDIRALGIDEDPYLHPELDGMLAIPTLRIGSAPTVRESLLADIRSFGSPLPFSPPLDLSNDGVCLDAAKQPREDVLWVPQPAHAISDIWSAARWCLDLLRARPDLRGKFPMALSDGADGAFFRWLSSEGVKQLELSPSNLSWLRQLLSADISARARQFFLFNEDIRDVLPHGLLPCGQRHLLRWFTQHGRREGGLRLEEIWWLLWLSAEQPALEVVRAYSFTPAWQEMYPDGLTIFGRGEFAAWLKSTYRVADAWTDPEQWPVDHSPARQLRAAYHAREQWRLEHPRALEDVDRAVALIEWLQSAEATPGEVRDWLSALEKPEVAADLVAVGVNVVGHFAYPSGLRVSVEAMVEGLHRVGVRTSLRDVRTDPKDDPKHALYTDFEDFDTTIIHVQPEPFFDVAHHRSDVNERKPRTYRIAYWYWEFDTIPDAWVAHAQGVDEVWTATEFVAKGLREKLSVPVRTMFPGVKLAPYERRSKAYFGLSEEPFTFLFTFHMMSVMERKNPLGLIRAFKEAFREEEAVRLVLKTSFGDRHPAQMQELRDAAAGANVTIIDQVYNPDEVLSLMDACDAYVSLHRSEGLGLTMAEAMLMGKPVIATNFSGNVDFMDDSNSLLVPYKLVKLGKPIPPYDADLEWAEPSEQHAAELMRRVYDNQAWAKEVGARGKASAEANLSLEAAGRRIAARLEEIKTVRRAAKPMSKAA